MALDPSIFMRGAELSARQNEQLLNTLQGVYRSYQEGQAKKADTLEKKRIESMKPENLMAKMKLVGFENMSPQEQAGLSAWNDTRRSEQVIGAMGDTAPRFNDVINSGQTQVNQGFEQPSNMQPEDNLYYGDSGSSTRGQDFIPQDKIREEYRPNDIASITPPISNSELGMPAVTSGDPSLRPLESTTTQALTGQPAVMPTQISTENLTELESQPSDMMALSGFNGSNEPTTKEEPLIAQQARQAFIAKKNQPKVNSQELWNNRLREEIKNRKIPVQGTNFEKKEIIKQNAEIERELRKEIFNRKKAQPTLDANFKGVAEETRDVTDAIDDAIEKTNWKTVGWGSLNKWTPQSDAKDLGAVMNRIQADAAFSRLQEMRDNSKSGGALGQVSERELTLLMNARAALDQAQSPEQFKKQLEIYRDVRTRSLSAVMEAYKEEYGVYPTDHEKLTEGLLGGGEEKAPNQINKDAIAAELKRRGL